MGKPIEGKPLISSEQYEYLCQTQRPYEGYVWTPEGRIYYVDLQSETSVKPAPTWPLSSYGIVRGTAFFDVVKTPRITEASLGSNDVLYTESGDFVTVIEATDPVEGEIKILKNSLKYKMPVSLNMIDNADIVNIRDLKLSHEAYSKIYTHILSLMDEVDLNQISQNKVISRNMRKAAGLYSLKNEIVIDPDGNPNSGNKILSKTVWNVLNMLGAHEYLGHKIIGWGDETNTHYLAYLFQMGHRTWEKTTVDFKKYEEDNLKDYIKDNRDYEKGDYDYHTKRRTGPATIRSDLKLLRKNDLYPSRDLSGQDSVQYNNYLIKRLQDSTKIRNPFKK